MMKLVNILIPFLMACFLLVETILASPSSRGNDESDIKESLEFIIKHPLNKERPASYLLGPPLTEEEIILTLQPVLENRDKFDLDQFIQLYQVSNGLKTLEAHSKGHPLKDIWLIPGYYLLSLREVVETLSIMTKTSGIWNPTWLPLFASRAGDFLVYDTKNGHIHELFTKESLEWEVAPNIQEFLQGIARKLRDGRILLNENGLFDVISTDVQTHEVHEDKILDLEILVEEDSVAEPELVFDCNSIPNICQNIRNAIDDGQPTHLRRTKDQNRKQANRRLACGHVTCKPPDDSCDEYPFASTFQGGQNATTKCVPLSENRSQGGQLKKFYNKNKVGDKDWFDIQSP